MIPERTRTFASAGRDTLTALHRDGRGWILLAVAFGWFLGLGMRLTAPVLVPDIRGEFGFGLATAGLLLSLLWMAYALFQLPGGFLGDRVGERIVLVASTGLVIVALGAGVVAWSIPSVFFAFALLGVATGTFATTRFTLLADIYPRRSATALGLSSAAGNVGTVVLPAVAGLLAAAATWRLGFAVAIPAFAVATVGLWLVVPSRTSGSTSAVDELSMATAISVLRRLAERDVLLLTGAMFLMSFIYQGFTSFYPTYLITTKGIGEGGAAILYSAFFAAGIVVQPVAGTIADVAGSRRTIVAVSLLAAAGLGLVVTASGFWALAAVSVLASVQLGFWPIVQAATIDALPTEMQGTGFGFLRTVYLLLAATSPTVVGVLAERGYFDAAFAILAGCAVLTAVIGMGLRGR